MARGSKQLEVDGDTVDAWMDRWLEATDKPRSERTKRHYRERVGPFLEEFGDRELSSFTTGELTAWLDGRGDGTARVLRAMFNDAVRAGAVPFNPLAGMRPSRESRTSVDILSRRDLELLLRVAARELGEYGRLTFAPLIEVAAWTGLGQEELFALAPENVSWGELCISVTHVLDGVTGERRPAAVQRKVALLEPAERALRAIGVPDLQDGKPIFRSEMDRPLSKTNFGRYWRRLQDPFVAALPEGHWLREREQPLRFGELEHFFGARLAERHVSPQDIAVMLGQKDGGRLAAARYFPGGQEDATQRVLEAFRRAA